MAVLFAGDGDYLPLIEAVTRHGVRVWVSLFDATVHREMTLVSDWYTSMEEWLLESWR